MVSADQNKRIGNETPDEEQIFCSSCAAKPHLFISFLNPEMASNIASLDANAEKSFGTNKATLLAASHANRTKIFAH
jgi:hypothetical protein